MAASLSEVPNGRISGPGGGGEDVQWLCGC